MNQYELDSVTPGAGNDSKLWIRFFVDAEQDLEGSETSGRPIFNEKEFIEIRIPGDKDEIRVRPVRFADTQQYPRQYAAFKAGLEQPVTGTPLDKLPFITKAQAAEMAGVGIKTSPIATLDIGYRYLSPTDARFDGYKVSLASSNFLVGIRYNF